MNTLKPLALGLFLAAAVPAHAQTLPAPQNVVALSASASVEVVKDWLLVALSTTREGADAAVVQSQLKQALDAALAEARRAARPGQLEVQTGGFSLYPRYGQKGSIAGWQGSTELLVQGRDATAISQLAGRINTLTIARVGYSLSREAREKVEADVQAEAIGRFRGRADAVSQQFGFGGWAVREVTVSSDGAGPTPQPLARMRVSAASAMVEEALPTEAGKATVTATVSGTVQLK